MGRPSSPEGEKDRMAQRWTVMTTGSMEGLKRVVRGDSKVRAARERNGRAGEG